MRTLSRRQQEILDRENTILESARTVLLAEGYYGLTMDRIAEAAECPKGTLYLRFSSKEDVIIALALRSFDRRLSMVRRGASYPGRARERMVGMGEGVALFARLHPNDSRILHTAGGPIREKASPERVAAMHRVENETFAFARSILADAVGQGDLHLEGDNSVERMAFAFSALVDGAYALMENAVPQEALAIAHPVKELWWIFNRMADVYGWRPFLEEQDWEETLAEIRRSIFPEEAQRLYGTGCWYGDAGFFNPERKD